jgi:hypothetical protein
MRSLPVLLLAALGACASQPPLVVRAASEGDACRAQIDGATFAPDELQGPRLRALRGRRLVVDADPDIPYRCMGGIVFMLQRAGFHIVSVRVNGVELPHKS